jgi:hypothetical protein
MYRSHYFRKCSRISDPLHFFRPDPGLPSLRLRSGQALGHPMSRLRNSCRPLKRTRFFPFLPSRHFRAGLSHTAAARLGALFIPQRSFRAECP